MDSPALILRASHGLAALATAEVDDYRAPMNLSAEAYVSSARDAVFVAFRNQLAQLVERSSNTRIAAVRFRDEKGPLLHAKCQWHGGGTLPAAVQGIVTPPMVIWTSEAIWDARVFVCEWKVAPDVLLPDSIKCSGRTSFVKRGDQDTMIQILGTVATDARKLPGVPSYLAGKVGRAVDEFIAARLQSNLLEMAAAAADVLRPVP